MQRARAVVFANGEFSQQHCVFAAISTDDFLVCVDGGIQHCLNAGLTPDLLIGDLDSLSPEAAVFLADSKVECVRFPPEKDASDLELALQILCDRSITDVVLLGASGGRTDHHLFNWQLVGSRVWPFQLRVIDDYVDAQLIDSERPFDSPAVIGQTFSVIALVGQATGVSVRGAQYPLNDACVPSGSTIGLSNVVTESRLQVSVEEGIVVLMLVHNER